MQKKVFSAILALFLMLGTVSVMATLPENAGSPEFEVQTVITPQKLSVYQDELLVLTATTTYTGNKTENQLLHFVSDGWSGVNAYSSTAPNERQPSFVSTAIVDLGSEPGEYDVAVRYQITLQHDQSGQRTYYASAETAVITVTVMEGFLEPPPEVTQPEETETPAEGQPLNHGQIVSAWAHWKQTKGNRNFLAGGPGVYRSLVWYKTQVGDKTFYSKQEVWDYLESIYEPAPRNNPGKGPGGNKPDNPNKGPGNNSGNP